MEPVVAPGGSSNDGNSMRWARSPRRIYDINNYKKLLSESFDRKYRPTAMPASKGGVVSFSDLCTNSKTGTTHQAFQP